MGSLPELFDLSGRVAIVTGGAGLLGEEFCQTLIHAGASIVIADIDGAAAKKIAAALNDLETESHKQPQDLTKKALSVQVDVTSKESVQNLIRSTVAEFGSVDILVNSAAIDPKFGPGEIDDSNEGLDLLSVEFEDYPLKSWNQAMDVNLTGTFLCCQEAGAQMRSQGEGVIINVCSIYGLVGPDQRIYKRDGERQQFKPAYYSVTKAGILGLTSYLATYYAGKNIRVNSLTPGGVYNAHDDEFMTAYSARTVLGRMAERDEINGALLFLASDASSYMTGGNLVVDGGWTAW
jgi:NAD(P)-dependent dehydrogenase (short-subunit alcohol dehydrogenase family)